MNTKKCLGNMQIVRSSSYYATRQVSRSHVMIQYDTNKNNNKDKVNGNRVEWWMRKEDRISLGHCYSHCHIMHGK